MEQTIENAIKLLAGKITTEVKADDALKFTQAALNLAHVTAVKAEIEIQQSRVEIEKSRSTATAYATKDQTQS